MPLEVPTKGFFGKGVVFRLFNLGMREGFEERVCDGLRVIHALLPKPDLVRGSPDGHLRRDLPTGIVKTHGPFPPRVQLSVKLGKLVRAVVAFLLPADFSRRVHIFLRSVRLGFGCCDAVSFQGREAAAP